jgi:hypothetical protein
VQWGWRCCWLNWLLMQEYIIQGLLLYSALLILLLIYGAYRWPHPQYRLVVLAIPAVVRLLALYAALGELVAYFCPVDAECTGGVNGRCLRQALGAEMANAFRFHRRHAPYYVLMVIIGMGVGLLLYRPQDTAWWEVGGPLLMPVFYGFVLLLVVFLEEWLFRDIMQTALTDMWPGVGMNNLDSCRGNGRFLYTSQPQQYLLAPAPLHFQYRASFKLAALQAVTACCLSFYCTAQPIYSSFSSCR